MLFIVVVDIQLHSFSRLPPLLPCHFYFSSLSPLDALFLLPLQATIFPLFFPPLFPHLVLRSSSHSRPPFPPPFPLSLPQFLLPLQATSSPPLTAPHPTCRAGMWHWPSVTLQPGAFVQAGSSCMAWALTAGTLPVQRHPWSRGTCAG